QRFGGCGDQLDEFTAGVVATSGHRSGLYMNDVQENAAYRPQRAARGSAYWLPARPLAVTHWAATLAGLCFCTPTLLLSFCRSAVVSLAETRSRAWRTRSVSSSWRTTGTIFWAGTRFLSSCKMIQPLASIMPWVENMRAMSISPLVRAA